MAVLCSAYSHGIGCSNKPRSVVWEGESINIDIPKAPAMTIVTLPEKDIAGIQANNTEGIYFSRPGKSRTPNQIGFSAADSGYEGLILIDGESGQNYSIFLKENSGNCDTRVKVIQKDDENISQNSYNTKDKTEKHSLIYYMYHDQKVQGFRINEFKADNPEDLLVMEIGSVKVYAHKQYVSRDVKGTIFKMVNTGAEAFTVPIDAVNYSDPDVRGSLGKVERIGMSPFSRTLGPAPIKTIDLYRGPANYGYLFVVSKR